MSKSQISQVKRGGSNPSLPLLYTIARVLGIPVLSLFVDDDPKDGIVRRDERQHLQLPGSSLVRELLVPDMHRRIILVQVHFEPGDVNSPMATTHLGEECVVVLAEKCSYLSSDCRRRARPLTRRRYSTALATQSRR